MTPIPTSYLARDFYRRAWIDPDPTVDAAATAPSDGERSRWGVALARLRRAVKEAPVVQGRPMRLGPGRA